MKKYLAALLSVLTLGQVHAEIFCGVTSNTNRLTVATNESILISSAHNQNGNTVAYALHVANGITNGQTYIGGPSPLANPVAIAGPCELVFTNNSLISFKRVQGTNIQTVILPPSHPPIQQLINVPEGKTIRFFTPCVGSSQNSLQCGGILFSNVLLYGNEEFSSPMTVTFTGQEINGYLTIYSYYFIEDFLALPGLGLLQGPTGNFELSVEKTTDLSNWFPVIVQNTSSDQKAFYRIRLRR